MDFLKLLHVEHLQYKYFEFYFYESHKFSESKIEIYSISKKMKEHSKKKMDKTLCWVVPVKILNVDFIIKLFYYFPLLTIVLYGMKCKRSLFFIKIL